MFLRSFLLFSFVCFYTGLDNGVRGLECKRNLNDPDQVFATLTVIPPPRQNRQENFTITKKYGKRYTSIQAAIDDIPVDNDRWIKILLYIGHYKEKIEVTKSCILLQGKIAEKTVIEFGDHREEENHKDTRQSATFTSNADNFVAKHITFVNTHNYNLYGRGTSRHRYRSGNDVTQAVAAVINGDKSAFYYCGFLGVQDTLFDDNGRHYFKNCFIEGAVDFIMGNGQSIYDNCKIRVLGREEDGGGVGYITAQKRSSDEESSGFVFKGGAVEGTGKAWLGRAWGSHARVIFSGTHFDNIIIPQGWWPWNFLNDTQKHFTYTDQNCTGKGNDTSKRQYNTILTEMQIQQFTNLSYIDAEGWISKQAGQPNY
ncbi:hypothetical protein MKW94_028048 [Papaver nudicaule]|uniref:pectinesterase n=1 Tax=Papaver nudicaule TaxID=74823 RepID=A0AA41VDD0_PAPNU|nr:hypothetical protein [Papaver nudicaule]